MRKKLFLLVLMILPISIYAQKKQFDWIPVIDAIIQVESKGNPKAHNPVGDCAGILQITKGLVRECNSILESQKSKKRYGYSDRYNATKSKEMFVLLQEHFNPEHNVEKAIRCWNRGFYGNWRGKSTSYYNKVMKHYKNDKRTT